MVLSRKRTLWFFCLIILSIYTIGLVIFMLGLLPVDHTLNYHKDISTRKRSQYNRIVLVVVDALTSSLLFSPENAKHWPILESYMRTEQAICSISHVQPPTVTLPRIKAITSGRSPKFADVIYNLNAHTDNTDSWVQRLSRLGLNLAFYGDDTWLKIFPNSFKFFEGTTSFFVNDYYEVDTNVTRHLDKLLTNPTEWDVLILHYLGLDHIGHVEGPNGPSMPSKLKEMDAVVGKIINHLKQPSRFKQDWLFILTGDHGMSEQGGHGGSSHSETSTGLFMLIPQMNRTENHTQTCQLPIQSMFHSNQVDLATLIGLATGSGIPSSSKGFIPQHWLHNIWPSKRVQLIIIYELLLHLARLSECPILGQSYSTLYPNSLAPLIDLKCSSNLLSVKEVQLYNDLCKSVRLWFDCRLNVSFATEQFQSECAYYLAPNTADTIIGKTTQLIRQVQSKIFNKAEHLNVFQMLTGCVLMWIVTLYLFIRNVMEFSTLSRTKIEVSKENMIELPTAHESSIFSTKFIQFRFVKLVCFFAMVVLFLHAFSSASSSLAEEEHQLWYNFSSSLFILVLSLVFLSGFKGKHKWHITSLLIMILVLDRFLLCCLHNTGYKWINLPDISDWLYDPSHSQWLWMSQLLGWAVVIAFRYQALKANSRELNSTSLTYWCPMVTVLLVVIIQLTYRYTILVTRSYWTITTARLSYLLILADLISLRRSRLFVLHQIGKQPAKPSSFFKVTLHEISALPLLVCLLGRPVVGILWIGVFVKEAFLCEAIQLLFDRGLTGTKELSFNALDVTTWLIYWAQGWVTYFQQGNSLSITTVDVTAGYVGLSNHQPLIVGPLLAFYTFAGPIFWQLAYFSRFSLPQIKRISMKFSFLVLAFLMLPITCCATFCFYLREHLFIWTVFTPKMLYMAVFYIVFIPFSCFWCYKAAL